MIAVGFLLLLVLIALVFAASGSGTTLPVGQLLVLTALFLLFFGAGVYIAAVLGVLGLVAGLAYSNRPFWDFIGSILWGPSTNFILVAVPLFLLMGEIMLRAGLSEKLYRSLNLWLNRMPGGLLHTNVVSCGVFSAVAGSSVATAATMGSVALPYFRRTAYDVRVVLGSLAAGGALGNLVPPGITFLLYGLITETSVGELYLAAVGPSILVILLFIGVILVHGLRHPLPKPAPVPLRTKLASLVDLVPTLLLILVVLGTIYAGLATPTESAALGVAGALVAAWFSGRLTLAMVHESVVATARTTAMIGLIIFGAYLLNYVLASLGFPQMMAQAITSIPLPGWALMALIIGFYLALGTFMEGFSMIITTIPLIFPIVRQLGYDPVWFGVVVTMLVEIAMISPPDGTVLYVLQGMRKDGGSISDIFVGVLPFVAVYILAIFILMAAPQIALWLPQAVH